MCGRFVQKTPLGQLQDEFGFVAEGLDYRPGYNVAPGREALAVLAGDARRGLLTRWGLVPSWAADPNIGYKMINARAETLAQKPAFKGLIEARRCVIPADGFYEWQKDAPGGKQPYLFERMGGKSLALAGLWDVWPSPQGRELISFTIITTRANELVGRIHERMPVILGEAALKIWLGPAAPQAADLADILSPYPQGQMTSRPVSRRVNSASNDGPDILEPDPEQGSLF